MKDITKRKMIEIAKDLGINNVDKLCDGVRDLLELYKKDIECDEQVSCQEIKNIEITRRTILEMQDELQVMKMSKIYTADNEAGNFIEEGASIEEGLKLIEKYEKDDKAEETFTENFYDVVDEEHCSLLKDK